MNALASSYTSRFGEVCWAQGGQGFGWWPSIIYDPRLTVGSARQLARKNLGKRHLVYFFACNEAPFTVLGASKITNWEDGMGEGYYQGKVARGAGKARMGLFHTALQVATAEAEKPIETRMDWNHTKQPESLPSPKKPKKAKKAKKTKQKRQRDEDDNKSRNKRTKKGASPKPRRGFEFLAEQKPPSSTRDIPASTQDNLKNAISSLASSSGRATRIECTSEDGELFCRAFKKAIHSPGTAKSGQEGGGDDAEDLLNIGFVRLKSRKDSTFQNAREAIQNELAADYMPANSDWKFLVKTLGPVSKKQEEGLGPILPFLQNSTKDAESLQGTLNNPLQIVIVESPVSKDNTNLKEAKSDRKKRSTSSAAKDG